MKGWEYNYINYCFLLTLLESFTKLQLEWISVDIDFGTIGQSVFATFCMI